MEKRLPRFWKLIVSLIFLLFFVSLKARVKAVWVPFWELTSAKKIDKVVEDANDNDVDQLIVQIRYRGDALYIPNKSNSNFFNPETRNYAIKGNFDALEYILDKSHQENIEVLAWLTAYVVTPHDLGKLPSQHIYYKHPEWITRDFVGNEMAVNSYEGAFLDPGLPQVQDYLFNLVGDIVSNYKNLDGIHLDYIRYPDLQFGYNELSRQIYKKEVEAEDAESWLAWKQTQVSNLVLRIYNQVKSINDDMLVTAAVVSDLQKAKIKYAQNWPEWLQNGYLDLAYPMVYSPSTGKVNLQLNMYKNLGLNKKIVVGLRAWHNSHDYKVGQINTKLKIARKMRFAGAALYSYTGIKEHNYFKDLKF
jgi:uncharacterized lipoprotein YddW (UPF0748 family)